MTDSLITLRRTAVVVALASAVAAVCRAASPAPLPESLTACAKLADPMERVHCYDAQMAVLNPSAAAPVSAGGGAPVAAAPAAPSPPIIAPAATVAPALPSTASPKQFGEEQLPSKARPAAPLKEEVLMSSITQMRTVGQKIYLIALANGQVWRQDGSQLPALFKVGNEVKIEKGALGSYHLSTLEFGDKNWVLVTRTH